MGTGEQRQYWGTRNIRKQIFDFWGTGEQANLFQGNRYPHGFCGTREKAKFCKEQRNKNNIGEQETYENKLELGGNKGIKSVLLTLILFY